MTQSPVYNFPQARLPLEHRPDSTNSMPAKRRKPAATKRKPKREPRFIEGIHHYCDRWCERCEFSHRCIKFTLTEELCGPGTAMRDGASQTVFDALSRVFTEARSEIERAAKKNAFDDEETLAAGVAVEKRLQRRALRSGSRETKAALTYAHMADEWFNNELKLPLQRVRDLERRVHQGLVSVAFAKGELVRLNDCVESIRWYQHLIYVKLCRAFSSRVEETEDRQTGVLDSDGSAKVALIALDNTIEAWTALQSLFPEKTDSVIEILVHLDRLRTATTKRFPKARKFKRPGFDEKQPRKKRRR